MFVSLHIFPHLILLQAALLHHLIPLLLKGDDDESHEDINKEERKNDKVDDVEDRHLHSVAVARTSVLFCHINGVLKDPDSIMVTLIVITQLSKTINSKYMLETYGDREKMSEVFVHSGWSSNGKFAILWRKSFSFMSTAAVN